MITNLLRPFFQLLFLGSLLVLSPAIRAQQTVWQPADWPVLKHYDRQHVAKIALPLGGIGTGTVSLGGRGQLQDWEIMNQPGKGYSTVTPGNEAPFFAVFVRDGAGKTTTKALLGPLEAHEYQHMEGRSVDHHGLPRFANATFDAAYPFGQVNLSDSTMPVRVRISGFNPLVPGDIDASSIPMAVLSYEVTNTTNGPLTVAVSGNIRNFIGKDGSKTTPTWKGEYEPTCANHNRNTFRQEAGIQGIYFTSDSVDRLDPAWGTMTLVTQESAGVTHRTSSVAGHWGNALLDLWDDFSADGQLTEKTKSADPDPLASLAVQKTIGAGQTRTFTFVLTWHFPNRRAWRNWTLADSPDRVGNYYTTRYADAWAVARQTLPKLPDLETRTSQFVRAFLNSPYPSEVKEAALFNVSTLRSQTVFRLEDGHLMGWEGVMDRTGSCLGSCTHVWNYEQTTAFLFGDLARSMRDVEFAYATDSVGLMSFRVNLPLEKGNTWGNAAADGQMGTIMKFYRDWQLSGNAPFLQKHWPQIRKALAFAWLKGGWDGDRDGVMEGVQHNTMDVDYVGPNPQMQLWYLGALRAGAEMARFVGDKPFAADCDRLFRQGRAWTDAHLFNGEYYEQQVQPPAVLANIAKGTRNTLSESQLADPPYQLAKGCLVDQLVGQYMAHTLGLGYLVDSAHVRTTLNSIMRYNYRSSMANHFNNMRSYAMGNEAALLMASWPKGRPTVPFPYFNEVMTGFEYTAAIGMLYEGQTEPGLRCIRNVRDRYDGLKRNPFDEAECGHHYTRAMAAWAATLALSGFQYSGVTQTLTVNAQPGTFFWSNGYAWGTIAKTETADGLHVTLSVLSGQLPCKTVRVTGHAPGAVGGSVSLVPGTVRTLVLKSLR